MPRTILVHLNVEVPDTDDRDAATIAADISGCIEVGADRADGPEDEGFYPFTFTIPLAEEV